ncbi:MAG: hypothetical protein GX434_14945 [Peptococcaceae bacterium]|nr:hypothetical protein [Peptococcaceae bacterium]
MNGRKRPLLAIHGPAALAKTMVFAVAVENATYGSIYPPGRDSREAAEQVPSSTPIPKLTASLVNIEEVFLIFLFITIIIIF